jgi:serine protease Do
MSSTLGRARFGAAVVVAFLCGLLFASAFDFTRFGYAQVSAKPTSQEVKPMADASNAFVSIAEHVTPAVVSIDAEREARRTTPRTRGTVPPGMEDFFRQFDPSRQQPTEAQGSGFIVSKDGHILTNNHVVEGADRVTVTLPDHRVFKAKVLGRDPTTDVAVIKIEGGEFPTVALGDDNGTRIGEWVLAIGNPLGLDFTVTAGIVSAKGRSVSGLLDRGRRSGESYAITDFIQTDAAINPGNSGGPLVNSRGEVIGINSAIASPTGYYSGYGFAIPISLAKDVMEDIERYGRVRRAVLGISIGAVEPEDATVAGLKEITGVKVGGYTASIESPAQKAGIEAGDIITRIDNKPVDKVSTLQRIVRTHQPGETIDVEVMRFGQKKTFKVKLVEAPSEEQLARGEDESDSTSDGVSTDKLGIAVEPVTGDFARDNNLGDDKRGLRVVEVSQSGPASHGKLFPQSDVITEILFPGPRRNVRSVSDLQKVLDRLKDGDVVSLSVYSTQLKQTRVVNVRVGS